jgi:hypothetical protein
MYSKNYVFLIIFAFGLSACQTTSIHTSPRVKVHCQSLSYYFTSLPRGINNCRRFKITEGEQVLPTERFVVDSQKGSMFVDLRRYSDDKYYNSVKKKLKMAYSFDFESQFKNETGDLPEAAAEFLRKLNFQFSKIISGERIAIWRASSTYVGNDYNGFAFIRFLSNAGVNYQLAGWYMEISSNRMDEDHFLSIVNSIKF